MLLGRLPLAGKFLLIGGIVLAALLGFGAQAHFTIGKVKVNGPLYKEIVLQKDLIADILPPPEYIIESYLTAFEMAGMSDPGAIAAKAARLGVLRKEFESRHAFWRENLHDPAMRKLLLEDAFDSAVKLYGVLDTRFLPAMREGRHDDATRLLYGELRLQYEAHRQSIDRLVTLVTAGVEAIEGRAASDLEQSATRLTIGMALAVVLLGLVLTLIASSIIRPLSQVVAYADAVAAGDFNGTLDIRSRDELGRLASAVKAIPATLARVDQRFETLVSAIEQGWMGQRADTSGLEGAFARLIHGGNAVADRILAILQKLPAPFAIMAPDMRVRFMNDAALAVGGVSLAEAQARTCSQVFMADDCNTAHCACVQALHSGRDERSETIARPALGQLDISYAGVPLKDRSGRTVAVMEVVTDLTAVKSAQRRMAATAQEATGIAARLASTARELSVQVEHVSTGTEQQRQRMEETAAAMEQMNASVLEVARSAGDTSREVEASRQHAENGAAVVGEVVGAMGRADAQALGMKERMLALGRQADGIGDIMGVIRDIADQTNLLALNAAIEAARAGEAGRGFAVVADEVRKLAEKTMNATKEVETSIHAIQDAARQSIGATESASDVISSAVQLASTSGETLRIIVAAAQRNAGQVAGIAAAAEEQSAASEQINGAVEDVTRIIRETAGGMAQSASAVHEVSRMSAELTELIRQLHG